MLRKNLVKFISASNQFPSSLIETEFILSEIEIDGNLCYFSIYTHLTLCIHFDLVA